MEKIIFLGLLLWGAYMDCRSQELDVCYLGISSIVGGIVAVISLIKGALWIEMFLSCSIGVILLGVSRLTNGGIGEGDGWFFIVSGLFLTWKENLLLLCSGWFLCFLYSLLIIGRSIGKGGFHRSGSIPFLPLLVPAGIYLTILAG